MKHLLRKIFKKKKRLHFTDEEHPERVVLLPYCTTGTGIDVGCGYRKTHKNCIGVDIVAKGEKGQYGCVKDKSSCADICTSGDSLSMFKDGELDFVISRHNLEHYVDVIKTLQEWDRVLKTGGILAMVLPDERSVDTIRLDLTHKHVFTPESVARYLDLMGGFEIVKNETVIQDWSFVCVARKVALL
jgi:ubiquinone/menaquinone biosynthesis C-methylase UbiE